jgi:adenylate kinase family enzyme
LTGASVEVIGQRISVVGTTGSGKTSLAGLLARRLALPHVELDSLHWGPDWTPVPPEVFRARVSQALQCPRWVCDGNYSPVRDIVWAKADTIIWLDYPLVVIMWQLLGRTFRRALARQELWQSNRESFRMSFFSQDSILLWALKSHGRRRREYPSLLRETAHAHPTGVRLRSPSATREWMQQTVPVVAGI